MKKFVFAAIVVATLASCNSKATEEKVEESADSTKVENVEIKTDSTATTTVSK